MKHTFQPLLACMLVALAATSPVRATTDADAHALVAKAIAAMSPTRDLRTLASMRSAAVTVSHDIVEFDHADAPYIFAGAARLATIDDLRGDRRLSIETPLGANEAMSANHSRTLFTHDTQQTDAAGAGGAIRTLSLHAPHAWETDEPIRALLLADRATDLVREADTTLHGLPEQVVAFRYDGYPVRIYIDPLTTLPSAIETTRIADRATSSDIAWNAWGDLVDRVELQNYDLADGVRYPTQSDLLRNGTLLRTTLRSDLHFDTAPVADAQFAMQPLSAPVTQTKADDLQLGQPISQAPDPKKPVTEIAPGIVQMPGSWFSTIVRQDDGLVIIDAPISAGYSRQVLAEAARRFPGMPVKALITSTAFYWHVAGVREYAAHGIPIYVRDRNVAVIRALLAAPHTLHPDDLARSPKTPVIHAVSAPTVIGRGTHAITVMPVPEGEQPMEMSWIADAHLLHTAEMVQPLGPNGALILPEGLLELRHSVRAAGIPTDGLRMIGMHMSPTPWSTLEQALSAAGEAETVAGR